MLRAVIVRIKQLLIHAADGQTLNQFLPTKDVRLKRLLCCETLLPDIPNKAKQKYAQLAGLPRPPWPGGRLGQVPLALSLGAWHTPAPVPASVLLDALASGQGCRHSSWQSTYQKAPVLFFIRTDLGTHIHSEVILPAKLWPQIVESLYFTNVVFTQADYSPLHAKSLIIHQACSSSIKWHHFKKRRDVPWRSALRVLEAKWGKQLFFLKTFHFSFKIQSNCHFFTFMFVNTLYFIIEFYSLLQGLSVMIQTYPLLQRWFD